MEIQVLHVTYITYKNDKTIDFTKRNYFLCTTGGFCFDVLCQDEPMMDNPDLEGYNVDERVHSFLQYVRQDIQR